MKWTEGGTEVSTDASYIFTVTANRNLIAVFEPVIPTYTVAVSASPTAGGSVSGAGSFDEGTSVTVTAAANSGYHFVKWTEGGTEVSTNASYTFNIAVNRNLIAVFEADAPVTTPPPVDPTPVVTTPPPVDPTPVVPTPPPVDPTPTPTPISNPFVDVAEKDYFFKPVLWAVANQITAGTSPTTFGSNDTCTRAQVVTFLWAVEGRPEPTTTVNPFKDVKETDWYYKAVLWAVGKNITAGTSATTFGPNVTCTRGQVVTFLWRAAGSPEPTSTVNPFDDVSEFHYFYKPVLWAVENKITSGTAPNTFGHDAPCTRAQVVTFLYSAENKK